MKSGAVRLQQGKVHGCACLSSRRIAALQFCLKAEITYSEAAEPVRQLEAAREYLGCDDAEGGWCCDRSRSIVQNFCIQ